MYMCIYQRLQASTSLPPSLLCNALPSPLEWAFALVRSRCIQVDEDWFGLLPVIDMANHSPQPNADLTYLFSSTAEQSEVRIHVCVYVCTYCMYVCMYVCMYTETVLPCTRLMRILWKYVAFLHSYIHQF